MCGPFLLRRAPSPHMPEDRCPGHERPSLASMATRKCVAVPPVRDASGCRAAGSRASSRGKGREFTALSAWSGAEPEPRWLVQYVTEGKAVSLLKAQLVESALAELRAGEREAAAKLLLELVGR